MSYNKQRKGKGVKSSDLATTTATAVTDIFRAQTGSSVPITRRPLGPSYDEIELMKKLNARLEGKIPLTGDVPVLKCIRPVSVAFPHCSDVLLAHVNIYDSNSGTPVLSQDDVTNHFDDYFMFCDHTILVSRNDRVKKLLDPQLLDCIKKWFPLRDSPCDEQSTVLQQSHTATAEITAQNQQRCQRFTPDYPPLWPPPWCLPPSCVTLNGKRHIYRPTSATIQRIQRLFIADLVWLFYFDMMGIFQILGVILDDFTTTGKLPISNGVIEADIRDDVLSLVLEAMIRETKTGLSSSVRDRDSSYRRCLGWTTDIGKNLGLKTNVNNAFTDLFHRFIQLALEFYKDRRLASINQPGTVGTPSMATIINISDTLELLKKGFDPFGYGRNYSNTLNGIVWVIAGMAMIRELRTPIGIPKDYEQPYEYIPAAYDILVLKRTITPSETNRYVVHRDCANDARDILLDLEVLDHKNTQPGGELDLWLNIIEDKVEGYRTAYRSLTGVDLGAPLSSGIPVIKQKV